MGILQRYILKDLIYYFVLLISLTLVIFTVNEMFDTRDEMLEYSPDVASLAQYIALSLPAKLVEAVPMVSLFSALFAIGLLARRREILAMVAAGASHVHIAVPVLVFGVGVSAFSFWLSDDFAPRTAARAHYIYKLEIKKDPFVAVMTDGEIFRKGEKSRFYIMSNFERGVNEMSRPTILDKSADGSGIAQRIEAKSAKLVTSESGRQSWEFEGARRWSFDADGKVKIEKFDGPWRIDMEEKLETFLGREKNPDEMTLMELREHAAILRRQGLGPQATYYETATQSKLAAPLACLFMAALAFAVAGDVRRGNFVVSVGTGLSIAIGYFMIFHWMTSAGRSGAMSALVGPSGPVVAAWLPVALFAVLAVGLFARMSRVR